MATSLHRVEELDHAVDQGVGADGAARDVGVDRQHLVDAAHRVVGAAVDAAAHGAGADGDHELGVGHLLVDAHHPVAVLPRDGAGADDDVGVARRPLEQDAEALEVEARHERGQDLDVAGVAGAGVQMEDPRGLDP